MRVNPTMKDPASEIVVVEHWKLSCTSGSIIPKEKERPSTKNMQMKLPTNTTQPQPPSGGIGGSMSSRLISSPSVLISDTGISGEESDLL